MSVGPRSKARLRPARLRSIDFARHASDSIKEETPMSDALVNSFRCELSPTPVDQRGLTSVTLAARPAAMLATILGTQRHSP